MKPLSPESPRRAVAREFGQQLRVAMAFRGLKRQTLARLTGVSRTSIALYLQGNNMPRLETSERLAEALDWPGLAELMARSRTYRCLVCPRVFVNDGMGPRRYCSDSCRDVAQKLRVGTPTRQRADRAERALHLHAGAVAAFCASCEPAGLCRTPECELRAVSPLPLALPKQRAAS